MTTVVCFRAGETAYAVPVEDVREVRAVDRLTPLPEARPGVVGLLTYRDRPLSVLDTLGSGSRQVLLLDRGERAFGLLVEEVTGVVTYDGEIGDPPAGQAGNLVAGVIKTSEGMALLVDTAALDRQFDE
jgi:purine-binding chemotaxis protein CheW